MAAKRSQDGLISLQLKNFQKFGKFKITFAPDVTTIVGPSDKGKSTILRALGCVSVGEPDGQELIRHDEDGYAVRLELSDHVVVRRRGKKGNVFDLDGQVLTRDRSDWPPAKVLQATRMGPENFQWQLDGPLWFLDSAGTVAKQLNKVVDLEAIDACLSAANSVAKESLAKQEGSVQEYESAKHAYRSLKWVPEMCAAWERLKEVGKTLLLKQTAKQQVSDALLRLKVAKRRKIPRVVFDSFAALSETKTKLENVARNRADLSSIVRRLAKYRQRAAAVESFRLPFQALADLRRAGESAARKRADLETSLESLRELKEQVQKWRKLLTAAKSEIAEVGLCPACGQPTKKAHKHSPSPSS